MDILRAIFKDLEACLIEENARREAENLPRLPKAEIKVLGQMALLLDAFLVRVLPLAATNDVDALIKGNVYVQQQFRHLLRAKNLNYDDLSTEIWLPKEHQFIIFHDSEVLCCSYLDPMSALVSKALKAPMKNRNLIRKALEVFKEDLAKRFQEYGIDPLSFGKQDVETDF